MKLLRPSTLSHVLIFFIAAVVAATSTTVEGQTCKPSGKLRGNQGKCTSKYGADCCREGKFYPTYKCSPTVTKRTKAILTINSFEEGGEGGGPSECDNRYHSDNTPVVALSTGWFNDGKSCHKEITIHGNGRSVKAKVVDECDSTQGCDKEHDFQPPCPNNIVDASKAVWKALGVPEKDWGWMEIFWSDN